MLRAADLAALRWIGEQGAVRADLLRRLPGGPPTDTAARRRVDRWHDAGLVARRRFLVGEPPVVWLTAHGLRLVGCPYRSREPPVGRLAHLHAVGVVRLAVEAHGGHRWVSERALARRRRAPDAHLPDGRFHTPAGVETAVEVELTPKGAERLERIVDELTVDYAAVLYVVDTPAVHVAVARAVAALHEQPRVTIVDLARLARVAHPG